MIRHLLHTLPEAEMDMIDGRWSALLVGLEYDAEEVGQEGWKRVKDNVESRPPELQVMTVMKKTIEL